MRPGEREPRPWGLTPSPESVQPNSRDRGANMKSSADQLGPSRRRELHLEIEWDSRKGVIDDAIPCVRSSFLFSFFFFRFTSFYSIFWDDFRLIQVKFVSENVTVFYRAGSRIQYEWNRTE